MKELILSEHDLKNMETVLGEEKDQVLQAQEHSHFPQGEEDQMNRLEGAIDFIRAVLKPRLKEVKF